MGYIYPVNFFAPCLYYIVFPPIRDISVALQNITISFAMIIILQLRKFPEKQADATELGEPTGGISSSNKLDCGF